MSGSNREFFTELLGFDPGKEEGGGEDVVQKAISELQAERSEKAKDKLKGIVVKVGELCRKRDQAAAAFKKEDDKFEKELGNLRKQVVKIQKGTGANPVPEESSEETTEQPAEGGGEG